MQIYLNDQYEYEYEYEYECQKEHFFSRTSISELLCIKALYVNNIGASLWERGNSTSVVYIRA